MAEFVDLCLQCLGGLQVVANGDRTLDELGDALRTVWSVEWSTTKHISGRVDLIGDRLPNRQGRIVALEEFRLGGQVWRCGELALVEDGDELEPHCRRLDDLVAGVFVDVATHAANGCIDPQRLLAFADLAWSPVGGGNLFPGVERRHQPVGSLGGEKELVVRRVPVKRAGDAQQVLPVLTGGNSCDGGGQHRVSGGEAFFVGGVGHVHDRHREPVMSRITARLTTRPPLSATTPAATTDERAVLSEHPLGQQRAWTAPVRSSTGDLGDVRVGGCRESAPPPRDAPGEEDETG